MNIGAKFKRLVRWLISEPPQDAIFGVHIREAGRSIHVACGHHWISEPGRELIRICADCGEEQWLMQDRFYGYQTWRKIERPE